MKLSPAHPIGKNNYKWHIAQLHIVRGLVKVPLLEAYVILLTIQITFCWEICYTLFIHIITYFPLLTFTELVYNPYDCSMAVWGEIFFANFAEYPSSGIIFTIDKLVNFYLVSVEIAIAGVMMCNKICEI